MLLHSRQGHRTVPSTDRNPRRRQGKPHHTHGCSSGAVQCIWDAMREDSCAAEDREHRAILHSQGRPTDIRNCIYNYSGTSVYVRFGISPSWYTSCLDAKNFAWSTTFFFSNSGLWGYSHCGHSGLLCQPRVTVKMIVEKQMEECRLAGETEVLGENMYPAPTFVHHKIPHDPWPDPVLNPGSRRLTARAIYFACSRSNRNKQY
jgi:hypothetical protein